MRFPIAVLASIAYLPTNFAQTFTDCNPLQEICPPNSGLAHASFSTDFTKGPASGWSTAVGTTIKYGSNGAEFTIAKERQAPTIHSKFHIFFGTVEVKAQAAPGVGIVSSIVLESSDLDEIDWEFIGGDAAYAQTNYYGKGNTTTYDRVAYFPVSPPPQTTMHTYTLDWSPERLVYSIDGVQVRVLDYADAVGGRNYPQTPMKIKLGSWAGGAPGSPAGTVEWAGGATDYTAGPFTMYVQSVKITNANPAKKYVWSDKSGRWQSIKSIGSIDVSSLVQHRMEIGPNDNEKGRKRDSNPKTSAGDVSNSLSAISEIPRPKQQVTSTPAVPANNAASTTSSSPFVAPGDNAASTGSNSTATTNTISFQNENRTKSGESNMTRSTHHDGAEATGGGSRRPGAHSSHANATALGAAHNATKPGIHAGDHTSTLPTTTRLPDATSSAKTGNSRTSGSGTSSGAGAASSTSKPNGTASSNPAAIGLTILVFTLSMCFWML